MALRPLPDEAQGQAEADPGGADDRRCAGECGGHAGRSAGSPSTKGVGLTRELVDRAGQHHLPRELRRALPGRRRRVSASKSKCWTSAAMRKLGMGALLGVAQGSVRDAAPARRCAGTAASDGDAPVAFVGKGVTFDTGGISIKPAAGMEDMKWDMGGAGAVAGAMLALATRKAKANVVGICGLVENMPDGKAQRPGDVVTTMSGQTIEVINTDAEGRLVLCDAITWVQRNYKPKIVDRPRDADRRDRSSASATNIGGLFSQRRRPGATSCSTPAKRRATSCGACRWRDAYDKLIDSPIADMKNVGPREAARSPRRSSSSASSRTASPGRISTLPAWSGPTSRAHLGQGRDRLRRAAARPLRRSVGGGALTPGCRSISTSSDERPLEQVIAAHFAKAARRGEAAARRGGRRRAAGAAGPHALGPGGRQLPAARPGGRKR